MKLWYLEEYQKVQGKIILGKQTNRNKTLLMTPTVRVLCVARLLHTLAPYLPCNFIHFTAMFPHILCF